MSTSANSAKKKKKSNGNRQNLAFLNHIRVDPKAPIYPKRLEPGKKAELGYADVVTNLFRAEITPTIIYRYRVEITGLKTVGNEERSVSFTDEASGDYNVCERRSACLYIFRAVIKKFTKTFDDRETLHYDLGSMLFSLNKLYLTEEYMEIFQVESKLIDNHCDMFVKHTLCNCTKFLFKVEAVEGELDTGVLRECATANFDQKAADVVQFLDIASSQDMIERPEEFVTFAGGTTYVFNAATFGYDKEFPFFPNDIYVGFGMNKGTRLIQGVNKQPDLAIAVEPQLTPFHYWENSVYDKVANILQNRKEMLELLRGLYVRPKHLHERKGNARVMSCKIQDIGAPANQQTFSFENTRITVEEYFQRNHGIPLQHPEAPVLIAKYGPHRHYYPMELCVVCDNQRVRNVPTEIKNQMIRYAAVPPAHYQPRTEKMAKSANFSKSNFLRKAGIKVHDRPIKLKARVIAPPEMLYKGTRSQFIQYKGRWQPSAFILPAPSPRIWAMCAFHAQRVLLNQERLDRMCDYFMAACHERGLQLINPSDCYVIEFDGGDRSKVFEEYLLDAVGKDCEFVIALTPKEDKQIHSFMKAFEQRYGIVTQNVLLNTMIDATGLDKDGRGKRLTMENIVNKTNVKLGGLNYEVTSNAKLLGADHLIIGFALKHAGCPTSGGSSANPNPPSVLGYSANDTKNTGTFAGDYIYQPNGLNGHLSSMHYATEGIFKRYLISHNKKPPNLVVIYRNGCSDGEFPKVLSHEVPMLQSLIDQNFGSNTKFVVMVVNKIHNVRLTPENPDANQSPQNQNLRSGTVVDCDIVDPMVSEFYLNSHVTLQGTAKIPRYSVLANNSEMKMDDLQRLTHDLCFTHQIVTCPVSKPTPSYVAEEYAKRGRNNFIATFNLKSVQQLIHEYADEEELDIELTNQLAYENHPHREKRINA
ncbi:hypothetical protein M3Y98_00557600 [Aphelenchoides besseyi]|nr:hypothetical protein M3Y98_00557600 [Aphelenchoides besseyi]